MLSKYRQCASAIVFNRDGKVLLGNRIDTKEPAWQFSQGGIEEGETPAIAAKRELFEEMGIVSVELIFAEKEPFRYDFPKSVRYNFLQRGIDTHGQDVYFCLFYFKGNNTEINVRTKIPEFSEFRWDTLDFAVHNVIDFKRDAYAHAATIVAPLISQYLSRLT